MTKSRAPFHPTLVALDLLRLGKHAGTKASVRRCPTCDRTRVPAEQNRARRERRPEDHQIDLAHRATAAEKARTRAKHNAQLYRPPWLSPAMTSSCVQKNSLDADADHYRVRPDPFELTSEMLTIVFPPVWDRNQRHRART